MLNYSKMFIAVALVVSSASMASADGYKYPDARASRVHTQSARIKSMAARAYAGEATPKAVKPFTIEEQRMFDRASVAF